MIKNKCNEKMIIIYSRFMFSLVIFNNQSLKAFKWSRWTEAWILDTYIKFPLQLHTPLSIGWCSASDVRGKSFGFISIQYCVIFQLELELCGNIRFYGLSVSSEWINDKIGDNHIQYYTQKCIQFENIINLIERRARDRERGREAEGEGARIKAWAL